MGAHAKPLSGKEAKMENRITLAVRWIITGAILTCLSLTAHRTRRVHETLCRIEAKLK